MEKETLKKIFNFIEENGGNNAPLLWKHINNIALTEEELHIKGDFKLEGRKITSLPEGLKVSGRLDLMGSDMQFLPKGLEVGGYLDLSYSLINSLPEGLKVGRSLSLFGCANITSLPEGLKVSGNLFIERTALTKYTNTQLREMIKPGFIKGKIVR